MKKLFYAVVIGLILFEMVNVYFIMPMPGSQNMESIGLAYFLYRFRWAFRIGLGALAAFSFLKTKWQRRWIPLSILVIFAAVAYVFNFQMAADAMFLPQTQVITKPSAESKVDSDRLVIGFERNGEARAYPIQFIGYHHQVVDTVGGQPIMVTYCTVCRTGRVFEPKVNGRFETFRLVGMDHFNAMFEDATTGSWWRQATGEAVAGKLKGTTLPELPSQQMALQQWLILHPTSRILQPDPQFQMRYDSMKKYDSGNGRSTLTRRDSLSGHDKSWVVGVKVNGKSKAFDWNRLQKARVLNDFIGKTPVVVALAADDKSFVAFERPTALTMFSIKNDTLFDVSNSSKTNCFNLKGEPNDPSPMNNRDASTVKTTQLNRLKAYQEFWHSWRTFNPETEADFK